MLAQWACGEAIIMEASLRVPLVQLQPLEKIASEVRCPNIIIILLWEFKMVLWLG